jgi:hypothetical protein
MKSLIIGLFFILFNYHAFEATPMIIVHGGAGEVDQSRVNIFLYS